jgi:hypothetical protein
VRCFSRSEIILKRNKSLASLSTLSLAAHNVLEIQIRSEIHRCNHSLFKRYQTLAISFLGAPILFLLVVHQIHSTLTFDSERERISTSADRFSSNDAFSGQVPCMHLCKRPASIVIGGRQVSRITCPMLVSQTYFIFRPVCDVIAEFRHSAPFGCIKNGARTSTHQRASEQGWHLRITGRSSGISEVPIFLSVSRDSHDERKSIALGHNRLVMAFSRSET